jgi:hypothetical protein
VNVDAETVHHRRVWRRETRENRTGPKGAGFLVLIEHFLNFYGEVIPRIVSPELED